MRDSANPIEHVLIIMQENRSFDEYLGRLNQFGYGDEVDGIQPWMSNPDGQGNPVEVFHQTRLRTPDIDHSWEALHAEADGGRNDGFVRNGGTRAMGYHEPSEIPFYYGLANAFAIGDRYFAAALGPTYPNRFFFMAGSAFGHTQNDPEARLARTGRRTLFDLLDEHGISWKAYRSLFAEDYYRVFPWMRARDSAKIVKIGQFERDLRHGRLPQVVLLDSSEILRQDEHPSADIQWGQHWVSRRVRAFLKSRYWKNSVLYVTHDESGGFFDHVPPAAACAPDSIHPENYSITGFRVPFIVVSPWVKRHFVSHATYDHASLLRYVESVFNLPALTRRDANADPFTEMFDLAHPDYSIPKLPRARIKLFNIK